VNVKSVEFSRSAQKNRAGSIQKAYSQPIYRFGRKISPIIHKNHYVSVVEQARPVLLP
jgi:hypothetical protein